VKPKKDAWSNHFYKVEVQRERQRLAQETLVLQAFIKIQAKFRAVRAREALVHEMSAAAGPGREPKLLALPGTINGQTGFYELAEGEEIVVARYELDDSGAGGLTQVLTQVEGPWSRREWSEVKEEKLAAEGALKARETRAKEADAKTEEVKVVSRERRRSDAALKQSRGGGVAFELEEDAGGDQSSAPRGGIKRAPPSVRPGPQRAEKPMHGFSVASTIATAMKKKATQQRTTTAAQQRREAERRKNEMETRVRQELKEKEEQFRKEAEEQMRAEARQVAEEKLKGEEEQRERQQPEREHAATVIQAQYRGARRRGVTHDKNKTVELGRIQSGRSVQVLLADCVDPFERWIQVTDAHGLSSKGKGKGGSKRRVLIETSVVLKQTNDKRITAALITAAGALGGAADASVASTAGRDSSSVVAARRASTAALASGGRSSVGVLQIEVKAHDTRGGIHPQPRKLVIGGERLELLLNDWRVRSKVRMLLLRVQLLQASAEQGAAGGSTSGIGAHGGATKGHESNGRDSTAGNIDDSTVGNIDGNTDSNTPPDDADRISNMSFSEALAVVLLHEREVLLID
jgi:hypothetical protein